MSEKLKINKLVSPSWSWLKINEAELDFDYKLENMLPELKNEEAFKFTENGTYLWSELPELLSAAGSDSDSIFEDSLPAGIVVPKGKKISKPLVLNYNFAEGINAITSQVIVAEEDSEAEIYIVNTSDKTATGFQALRTEIYAKANAKVHVLKVQLLGNNYIQVDDTASYSAENAEIKVDYVELGASKVYLASGCNLKEYKASFKSDMGYYVNEEQFLDMNFLVNHYGKKTVCRMNCAGSLKDKAKKTYRATIDFKKGSAGSDGNEQEETLLLSPEVVNNSMPVILCTEEDIAGEHGATIGRLSDDMLFYMESRGLDKKVAENVLARAKVQTVVSEIKDGETVEKIEKVLNEVFGQN